MDVIHFYSLSEPFGCLSNFSPHPIRLNDKTWPTSEQFFQAMKFVGKPDEEEVRKAKSHMIAAQMGRSRKRPLRKDWESVKDRIMHEAVTAKFTQHADIMTPGFMNLPVDRIVSKNDGLSLMGHIRSLISA